MGFRDEGFSDALVIGVVGMNGEDPGQALVDGVGGGEVVRVQALVDGVGGGEVVRVQALG